MRSALGNSQKEDLEAWKGGSRILPSDIQNRGDWQAHHSSGSYARTAATCMAFRRQANHVGKSPECCSDVLLQVGHWPKVQALPVQLQSVHGVHLDAVPRQLPHQGLHELPLVKFIEPLWSAYNSCIPALFKSLLTAVQGWTCLWHLKLLLLPSPQPWLLLAPLASSQRRLSQRRTSKRRSWVGRRCLWR